MHKIYFRIKAVIFDMDGVITDTMPYHYRAWKTVFKKAGLGVSRCEIYLREGQPGSMTIKEIFEDYHRTFAFQEAKKMLVQKERFFKKIVKRRFVVGSRSFLAHLKSKDIKVALVTGTSRHEVIRILPKRLLQLFSAIVTSDEVKKGKPHPEPYLTALRRLKIRPNEAIVLENAPFGIHAAKRAGLKCLALETSLSKTYLKSADGIFSTFADLRRKVIFQPLRNN